MSAPEPTPVRPRGRPGHDRDAVLRCAINLFNQQGYDATSIDGLAKDLGITKSGIYHHFDSKESILAAALDEALDELSNVVEGAETNESESAYDLLVVTIKASVGILVEHLPAVTLLLRVRGNSELEQRAIERRRHIDEQLARLVHNAAAEGSLRADIDPDLISRLIFGMVNSLVEWFDPKGPISSADIAVVVTAVVFEGLASSPSASLESGRATAPSIRRR